MLTYTGPRALLTIAALAAGFGLQNATVRRIAAADLTTTVLTLTLTGLAADSALASGPGARPHRRLGSILAMLAGAAAGALLLQIAAPTMVIALATILVISAATLLTTAPGQADPTKPGLRSRGHDRPQFTGPGFPPCWSWTGIAAGTCVVLRRPGGRTPGASTPGCRNRPPGRRPRR